MSRVGRGEHATTGTDQISGRRPVTLVVGAQRSVVARSLDCGWSLAIAGVQRTGQSVAPQSSGPGSSWRQGPPRACSVSNATPPSVKCQAGTHAACPVQQWLRYIRCWLFSHIGGLAAWSREGEGRRDAARIAPSCICKDGPPACWMEFSAQEGDEHLSTPSEPANCPFQHSLFTRLECGVSPDKTTPRHGDTMIGTSVYSLMLWAHL